MTIFYKTDEVRRIHGKLSIETKRDYRSRRKFWKKGESSGNKQIVHDILIDCDAIVLKIEQIGDTCHTGYRSCFYRTIEGVGEKMLELEDVYKK